MTDNPLPCPFCGASGDESLEVCANVVSCMECGAYGPRQEGIELFCDSRQAIKDWNRRDFSPATIVSGVVSAICRDAPPAPQVMAPADYQEKLSSFLDALDEWGCDDNGERAEHIIEFQRTGYDLDAYLEDHPDRPKQEVN